MAANSYLVTGPAGAGKTLSLLKRYRQLLAEQPLGSVLWLVPTYRAAAVIREQLLTPGLPGCLRPNVVTFAQFAESILRASQFRIRPVTALMKRHLLRTIVERGLADARLPYFEPIVQSSGFLNLLEGFISELKRLEIWPEHFQQGIASRRESPHLHELAWIYAEYQRLLTAHRLYDAEGRFWTARELLRERPCAPYDKVRFVFADGFADFTTTQHEILSILASRGEEVYISLPLDDGELRGDLFQKSLATLTLLSGRLPCPQRVEQRRPSDTSALAHLERQLFLPPRHQRQVASAGQVALIRAAGELREVEEIARVIKRLMLDDSTIRPDDIVVVFRALSPVADLVRETFDRLGIPCALESGQRLSRIPALRALIGMLRLVVEDWPYRQVLATIGSSYYRIASADPVAALAATERLIHELQIPHGRAALLRQIAELAGRRPADESDEQLDPHSRTARALQVHRDAQYAAPLLEELAARLDTLPVRATASKWAEALTQFATVVGLLPTVQAQDDSADRVAWQQVVDALVLQERMERQLDDAPRALKRAELLNWLSDMLERETLPILPDEIGRVRVLSASSARNLRIPYLFVAGLSETSFPKPRDAALYDDADLEHLQPLGLSLSNQLSRDHDEMLLFYEVVTRASRRIWFSYASLDAKAQELLPSPYLAEIESLIAFDDADRVDATDPRPLYGVDRVPLSWADWRVAATAQALKGEHKLLGRLLREPARRTVAANMKAGLITTHERSRRTFSQFEGILVDPRALQRLRQRFGPEHVWSASRLEQYAKCPFHFFLEQVLRVRELREIAVDLNPVDRGSWLHKGLAGFHRRLNELADRPTSPALYEPEQLRELVQAALAESRVPQPTLVAEALCEITHRILLRWCEQYHEQHRTYDELNANFDNRPVPAHFEASFGMPCQDGGISTEQPLMLPAGEEVVRIAGRIDRIDVGMHAGQPCLMVVDYKSGKAPKVNADDVDGTALQLELYSMAAEQVLFAGRAIVARVGYWSIRHKGYQIALEMCDVESERLSASPQWQQRRQRVTEKVGELVTGVRQGQFPVYSLDDQCTSQCPYRTICRVNQVRALEKEWPPTPDPQRPVRKRK